MLKTFLMCFAWFILGLILMDLYKPDHAPYYYHHHETVSNFRVEEGVIEIFPKGDFYMTARNVKEVRNFENK